MAITQHRRAPFAPGEPIGHQQGLRARPCLFTLRVRPSHDQIVIESDLAGDLPKIFADRQQLKQVILNFLFNAVEAMLPDGGV